MANERYLAIVAAVDAEFERNRRLHGERIRCRAGCTDCCHHRFVITPVEAVHIAEGVQRLETHRREALAARAREYLAGPPDQRRACPALDEGGVCSIYEHRPLICHKFGMPIFNPDRPGRIFACELNFRSGEEIHDPDLIRIQTGIHQAWKEVRSESNPPAAEPLTVARAILEGGCRPTFAG